MIDLTRIKTNIVEEDPYVPARLIGFRKDGSKVESADRFLGSSLITLFSLITGEQLTLRAISTIIRKKKIKVDNHVLSVL